MRDDLSQPAVRRLRRIFGAWAAFVLSTAATIYVAEKAGVMDSTALLTEQPPPAPNAEPSVQEMVLADIHARMQVGLERYGTLLQPGNGRDALRDAYEEALDLAMYLRQAIAERDATPRRCYDCHRPAGAMTRGADGNWRGSSCNTAYEQATGTQLALEGDDRG